LRCAALAVLHFAVRRCALRCVGLLTENDTNIKCVNVNSPAVTSGKKKVRKPAQQGCHKQLGGAGGPHNAAPALGEMAIAAARRASHVRLVFYNIQINVQQFRYSFFNRRGARHTYVRTCEWFVGGDFVRLLFYSTQSNWGQFRYSISGGEARVTRTFGAS